MTLEGDSAAASRTAVIIHSGGGFTGMTVDDDRGMKGRAVDELRRLGAQATVPIAAPPRSEAVSDRHASEGRAMEAAPKSAQERARKASRCMIEAAKLDAR